MVIILALETSCDETSVAVVADGTQIKANIISSQVDIHRRYGGVVPEIASRRHIEKIGFLVPQALAEAGITWSDIRAVAVTYGPGLVGALLVGLMTAKGIAYALRRPLLAVNHLEGHIYANFLTEPRLEFPLLCLVVSGGHTDLVWMEGHGVYRLLGRTRDDAAGEAFDKVARYLDLGYPGGPAIERVAARGNPAAVALPRAYLEEGSFDFSFSGLKTAVLNYVEKQRRRGGTIDLPDLAASFQQAVVDVLVDKTVRAAVELGARTVLMAGGVAANSLLRSVMSERLREKGIRLVYPPPLLCTDNAAMIACAGYYKFLRGDFAPLSVNARPSLELGRDEY